VYNYSYGTYPTVDLLTSSGLILMNFGIPAGPQGIQGNTGAKGDTGDASGAQASTVGLGIMSAFGFGATALSLGLLQSEIQALAATITGLSNSLATLQLRVSAVIDTVNELQKKTKYLDCDRSGLGLAYLNSSINIGSNCVVGSNYNSQFLVNGKGKITSDVQIDGNLIVKGNISYGGSNSSNAQPFIQF
jgi:hypothetical protein